MGIILKNSAFHKTEGIILFNGSGVKDTTSSRNNNVDSDIVRSLQNIFGWRAISIIKKEWDDNFDHFSQKPIFLFFTGDIILCQR